ncbi:MAG: tetratricopeptide repeat protein, partial [Candidatus Eisenbacteria bacterium]|nr:tetratricopeptide repeat protein [Candidatus Eisenbacteria bacterium]
IAPLSVYQTRAAGQLVLLTPNGGLNLFIGNNPAARGIYSNPPELDIESDFTGTRSASLLAGRTLTIAESSRFWAARSVGFLTQDPGRAAWLLGRKILLYFSPREIPQIENFSRIATDTPPLRVAFLRFGWILPFAVWGAVSGLARRRRRSTQAAETVERWPFVALVVTGWIATIVFFAAARYRIPMVPGFLVLAAIGIVELWRNRRTPGRLLPGTAVIVAVAALLTVLPSYPVARADANSDYLLGLRLSRNGQHEDAIRIFHRALELDPASGEAWHGIGVAMAAQGRLTEATEAYRHALETMPLSTWTYYNLGVCLEQLERFSEAAEAFGAAVSLQPDDANLRYRWGAVLARLGRTADAVEQLESAVRIDSGLQPATALLRRLRAEQEGN